jgi:hypothetical protein
VESITLWSHRDKADGLIYIRVNSNRLLADAASVARILEKHRKSVALP